MTDRADALIATHPRARAVREVVDRVLLEQGELDPFECLLELGFMTHSDYMDWRAARRPDLQCALLVPVDEAIAALELAQGYAKDQSLCESVGPPPAWDMLSVGASRRLSELCGCVMRRSAEQAQMDLFHDSAPTAAVNALRTALLEHRTRDAQVALRHFGNVSPDLHAVAEYRRLLRACEPSSAPAAERLRELVQEIVPIAERHFGTQAIEYLSPQWTELAAALIGTAFSPTAPKLHASYAYARARQWEDVARTVEAEPDWFRHEALIARLAEAHARQRRPELARLLWMRLCWEHPGTASGVLEHAPGDPVLARLWREFLGADAALGVGDFPAWLLLADRQQSQLVPAESAPDNTQGRAYAAMHRVVSDDDIEARKALRAVRPDLFGLYMAVKQAMRDRPGRSAV